jgi:heptosyltransferase I
MFRILVIRLGSLGDVIHALPAVASLKHSYPKSHLSWIIKPQWATLLEGNPYVDEIIPYQRTAAGLSRTWRVLRKQRFNLAVDLQGLMQSALVATAARAEKIVGLDRTQAREPLAALFYSTTVKTKAMHRVDRYVEIAAAAGATNTVSTFPLPQGEAEGVLPEGRFVLASPQAGWTSKQWPLEYYEELAAGLKMPLVLNGSPAAEAELAKVPGARVHVSGIAGLIDATRRAYAVIGVDSGPLHIAAALSKPGVAIYGPTDPAMHGPYGGSLHVLRSRDAVTSYKRGLEIDPAMRAIQPAEVLEALHALP